MDSPNTNDIILKQQLSGDDVNNQEQTCPETTTSVTPSAELVSVEEETKVESVVSETLIEIQEENVAKELSGQQETKVNSVVVPWEKVEIEEADKVQLNEPDRPNTPVTSDDSKQQQTFEATQPNPDKSPNKMTREHGCGALDKKKEDEKLGIYKALAIKLKKELVKCREELQKIKSESKIEISTLKEKVQTYETQLDAEKQTNSTIIATLEARVKGLQQQLDSTEFELRSLQSNFENYKIQASKIIQQNGNQLHSQANKTIEEDRFKQLKQLNDDRQKCISNLEAQLSNLLKRNQELEGETKKFQDQLSLYQEKVTTVEDLESKCQSLALENENLKTTLKQYRSKFRDPTSSTTNLPSCDTSQQDVYKMKNSASQTSDINNIDSVSTQSATTAADNKTTNHGEERLLDDGQRRGSPSASVKDDSQTNSSSSFDGSTSGGYVHIKPNTFEIISRSSVLEDAQNQIDNLTKAYLESENTNSLLLDQVKALKEEIRRLQLVTERIELADNLEYLKNIVFKFLSLDSSQTKQKQRLVPVLSTVLKLSPEETAKLNSIAITDKSSMASTFFKL